jgi:hypothetical protein
MYNHWFWNSRAMKYCSKQIAYLDAWIWRKMWSKR